MSARVSALCLSLSLALPLGGLIAACATQDPVADSASQAERDDHDGDDHDRDAIHKVKHVIVIMQENHSFDNYFGALAYAPGSPFHGPRGHHHDDGDGDR